MSTRVPIAVEWMGKTGMSKSHRSTTHGTACGTPIRVFSRWYSVRHSTLPLGPRCRRCWKGWTFHA